MLDLIYSLWDMVVGNFAHSIFLQVDFDTFRLLPTLGDGLLPGWRQGHSTCYIVLFEVTLGLTVDELRAWIELVLCRSR